MILFESDITVTQQIENKIQEELKNLLKLSLKHRKEYNTLIKQVSEQWGIHLKSIVQGRKKVYTLHHIVWVWLEYIVRNLGEEPLLLTEILERINNKKEPFTGEIFEKSFKNLINTVQSVE